MKRINLIFLSMVLLISFLNFAATISGKVTNSNNQPIEGAIVRLIKANNSSGGMNHYQVTTNHQGNFIFTNVNIGNYYAMAQHFGFYNEFYNNAESIENAELIQVNSNSAQITNINFSLNSLVPTGTGQISGTIVNSSQEPLNGMVIIFKKRENTHGPWNNMNIFKTIPFQNGSYMVNNLPLGKYYVFAKAMGPYIPEFYNNAYLPQDADSIVITQENNVYNNINFVLDLIQTPGVNSISGTVRNQDNEPVRAMIRAIRLNDENNKDHNSPNHPHGNPFITFSDSAGNFNLRFLPNGNYVLKIKAFGYISEYYQDAENIETAQILELNNSSINNINIILNELEKGSITGFVTDETTGSPIDSALIIVKKRFSNELEDTTNIEDCKLPNTIPNGHHFGKIVAITNSQGFYEIPEIYAGEYIIMAVKFNPNWHPGSQLPKLLYIPEFFDNKTNPLEANVVNVTSSGNTTINADGQVIYLENINFALTPMPLADNSISGKITINGETPTINTPVLVSAISTDGHIKRFTHTDEQGNYILENLPEKEYYVMAMTHGAAPTYYPGTFSWQEATPILANDAITNINIDLIITDDNVGPNGICGKIKDSNNNPINGAIVYLYDNTTNNNVAFATTNAEGKYFITGINKGTYNIFVDKLLYSNNNATVNLTSLGQNSEIDITLESTVGIEINKNKLPFKLNGNAPNPFNPITTISYSIYSDNIPVKLEIFNIKGELVKTLLNGKAMKGEYKVVWNSEDNRGNKVATGIYFIKLSNGQNTEIQKMLLLK